MFSKPRPLPPFIVLYGPPGIGKSSWAAAGSSPIVLDTELSAHHLSVDSGQISSSADLRKALDYLLKSDHKYRTVVIDTLDRLEALIGEEILAMPENRNKNTATACGGFGRYFAELHKRMTEFRKLMFQIRSERQMTIVCLAHSSLHKTTDPDTGAEVRFNWLKLHEKTAADYSEFSDFLIFADSTKLKVGDRLVVGQSRTAYLQSSTGWVAKNRAGLTGSVDLNELWNVINSHYRKLFAVFNPAPAAPADAGAGAGADAAEAEANRVRLMIKTDADNLEKFGKLDTTVADKIRAAVNSAEAGELDKMLNFLNKLKDGE